MSPSTASKLTTNHDEIRRWAEERGAKPAAVRRTERKSDAGILGLDFPGYGGEGSLSEISWDDWFRKFDEQSLALLYQEQTANGERSNFNKIISRETVAGGALRNPVHRSTARLRRAVQQAAVKKPARSRCRHGDAPRAADAPAPAAVPAKLVRAARAQAAPNAARMPAHHVPPHVAAGGAQALPAPDRARARQHRGAAHPGAEAGHGSEVYEYERIQPFPFAADLPL